MKTYYDLLSLEPSASADEVKRAFRREIARYHPDKVQHLGPEFQEIAASRAAALTEAYRILMDVQSRRSYDDAIADGTAPAPHVAAEPAADRRPPVVPRRPAPEVEPEPVAPPPPDRRFQQERATTTEFLRRAVLVKVRDAAQVVGGEPITAAGFDAAFSIKAKRGLFKKAEPSVRLLVRVVPVVDAASIEEAWLPASRANVATETLCLLLLGSGISPAKELSTAVSDLRRRRRQNGPTVVPVDMRDWEALFPPDTPVVVRTLLEQLRQGQ